MNTAPNNLMHAPATTSGKFNSVFSQAGEIATASASPAAVAGFQHHQLMKLGINSQFVLHYQHSRNYFLINN